MVLIIPKSDVVPTRDIDQKSSQWSIDVYGLNGETKVKLVLTVERLSHLPFK